MSAAPNLNNDPRPELSAVTVERRPATEAEYLALAAESDIRHEFIGGEILAMSGASNNHTIIGANLVRVLGNLLLDSDCVVRTSDMRVKTAALPSYTFPDLTVTCGPPQFDDRPPDTLLNPTVIVEVLSPSTEARDRGVKFRAYRQIPTLQQYVLVAQAAAVVEVYTRRDDDAWVYVAAEGTEAAVELSALGCTLPLAEVYRRVPFDDDTPLETAAPPTAND